MGRGPEGAVWRLCAFRRCFRRAWGQGCGRAEYKTRGTQRDSLTPASSRPNTHTRKQPPTGLFGTSDAVKTIRIWQIHIRPCSRSPRPPRSPSPPAMSAPPHALPLFPAYAAPPPELRTRPYSGPFEVKHRKRTSRQQFRVLEDTFLRNQKPNAVVRRAIAQQVGMTLRGVQVWFQNRRAKLKKQAKAAAAANPSAPSEHEEEEEEEELHASTSAPVPYPLQPEHFPLDTPVSLPDLENAPSGSLSHADDDEDDEALLPRPFLPYALDSHYVPTPTYVYRSRAPENPLLGRRKSLPASHLRLPHHPYAPQPLAHGIRHASQSHSDRRSHHFVWPPTPLSPPRHSHEPHRQDSSSSELTQRPHSSTISPVDSNTDAQLLYPPRIDIPSPLPGPLPTPDFSFGCPSSASPAATLSPVLSDTAAMYEYGGSLRGEVPALEHEHDTEDSQSSAYQSRFGSFASTDGGSHSDMDIYNNHHHGVDIGAAMSAGVGYGLEGWQSGDADGPPKASVYPEGFQPDLRRASCPAQFVQYFSSMGVDHQHQHQHQMLSGVRRPSPLSEGFTSDSSVHEGSPAPECFASSVSSSSSSFAGMGVVYEQPTPELGYPTSTYYSPEMDHHQHQHPQTHQHQHQEHQLEQHQLERPVLSHLQMSMGSEHSHSEYSPYSTYSTYSSYSAGNSGSPYVHDMDVPHLHALSNSNSSAVSLEGLPPMSAHPVSEPEYVSAPASVPSSFASNGPLPLLYSNTTATSSLAGALSPS
ncbi:hypothetical protein BOTBODRAFT_214576 [Botryobasidium botryosum FD-172 SS1]|uniref:Homeobox domain-containing protein n=1 Tax=Botryobasidium botryosum (strain FD-172 SS1) TaxID=930990 RepID=A0A067N1Z3_BOTB1|nr:hypothetical protein BOTBODRAFT_214576 [Botryobasidium botryosum FD-172 SS1]